MRLSLPRWPGLGSLIGSDSVESGTSHRGPAFTAAVVLLLGLAATAFAWHVAQREADRTDRGRFEYRTDRVRTQLLSHLEDYDNALFDVASLIGSSPAFERAQWRRYFELLGDRGTYPGREAIAYAPRIGHDERTAFEAGVRAEGLKSFAIIAKEARDEYFPVTYLRAFSPGNVVTLGLDLGSDPVAREAIERARDTGQTTLTASLGASRGPAESEQVAAMIAPVYAAGSKPRTVDERRVALRGFVVEAFNVMESVGSTLGPDAAVIGLQVRDAGAALFTCPEMQRHLAAGFRPALARTVPVTYGGREWTLEFAALPPFHAVAGSDQPKFVLIAGILISTLLSGLVGAIAHSRARALVLVRQRTGELRTALAGAAASETRMRAVVDHVLEAIVTIDERGTILSFNSTAVKMFGFAEIDVVGRNVGMLMPAAERERHDGYLAAYLATGTAKIIGKGREVEGRRADGTMFPIDLAISEMWLDGKRSFCGILRDITEQRGSERALAQNERKLRSYIDQSLDGVLVVDGRGRYLEANPAACALLGYPPSELFALSIQETLWPDEANQQAGAEHFRRVVETGTSQGEVVMRRKDGGRVVADINAVALGNDRFLGLLRDVTERRLAAQMLEQERGELEQRVLQRTEVLTRTNQALQQEIHERRRIEGELRDAREQALQAAEAKARFLANMSHEIRTPMNAVIGMAALLDETAPTAEQRGYLDTIRVSGDALLRVINDILDYSKIESGMLLLERHPLSIASCVEEAIDMVATETRSKGLDLLYHFAANVPAWISGDPTRLRQILVNLLANAVKFTERGEVCVDVACVGRPDGRYRLRLAVRDTGIGIPADKIAQLFHPFTQADSSTTRRYGGTGLGLAICARLARLMGGDIGVDSVEGRGSTFHFTIVADASPAGAAERVSGPIAELAGRRALIVDDNPTNLQILAVLCRRWGLAVTVADGGAEALGLLATESAFDLAVLDMVMPGMDGVTLAREIRQRFPGRHPALVLLSSADRRADHGELAQLFAMRLAKPIKHSHLAEALVAAIAGPVSPLPDIAPPGRLDPTLAARLPLSILVVEDSVINQKLAVGIMDKMGYTAEVAANGAEAIELIRTRHFDLVFMDLQMPIMDGFEATRRIVADGSTNGRPRIIAMTANALTGDRERCLEAGADDYIAKPVLPSDIQRMIEQWGSPPVGAGADPLMDARTLSELRALSEPGRPSLLRALVQDYLAEAPVAIREIRKLANSGESIELAQRAHKLAGISLSLGAAGVANACLALETCARQNGAATFGAQIDTLEVAYARTRTHLFPLL